MTFDEVFKAAALGEEAEYTHLREIFAYELTRYLMAMLTYGEITKNEATREKIRAQRLFEADAHLQERYTEGLYRYQENIRNAKGSLCEVERLAVDQPDAVVLDAAIRCIAAMVGDDVMHRRFEKKREAYNA